jgi:hypothetical protein
MYIYIYIYIYILGKVSIKLTYLMQLPDNHFSNLEWRLEGGDEIWESYWIPGLLTAENTISSFFSTPDDPP